ncbi:splicing factor, suppressor of white-apricot homolog isoform X1 [Pleurodeles waltl]|uniref:splicing factor, suppressor of white-apricot homolog isoform X1 n=1 Tax=Pleurodeles waltl TaxID=8319 RepID=UPI00370990B3
MYVAGPRKSAMKQPAGVVVAAAVPAPEPAAPEPLGPKADLLVFGYACKVFRDDEMARYQERGRHLIPWMGDPNTLIDRYDGRGHLHDLSDYDAEHTSWNRNYHLSEEEARIEALCDEERYLALHTDLLEEEARQEEEYKRLSEALAEDDAYNSVGFCYNSDYYDPSQPTEEEESQKEKVEPVVIEESEEPFIAPLGANVPSDVELPPTAKMHAIIERTAKFVCLQGAQFEIMLKTKQARNSQFDFLRFDHYLYPYYKHIVKAMKEGRYTSYLEKKEEERKKPVFTGEMDEDEDDEEYDDYLHPSLSGSKKCSRLEELMKPLNVMDPDHPLAALVRKAQSENNAAQLLADNAAAQKAADKAEAQQAADKAEAQQAADKAEAQQQADSEAAQAEAEKFSAETSAPPVYYSYYVLPDGTYCLAPPPAGVDVASYYSQVPAGVAVPTTTGIVTPSAPSVSTPPPASSPGTALAATVTPASALAPVVAIIPPPPDIQPVIDKLAQYVSRNGIKFETSVRAKNDPRFDFLQPWHEYNPYYEFKKQFFLQKEGGSISQEATTSELPPAESVGGEAPTEGAYVEETVSQAEEDVEETDDDPEEEEEEAAAAEAEPEDTLTKSCNDGKMKVSFAPISFAIRAKENDMLPLEKNRVKLYDDSEDEEEGQEEQNGTSGSSNSHPVAAAAAAPVVTEEKKPQLTPEEIEARQAKQRLEDRLAAAAREKLAQAAKESREKQLQAERKRKAALFLQTLKNPLELECERVEEGSYSPEIADDLSPEMLDEDRIEPITEYRMEDYDVSEYKIPERPSKRIKEYNREITVVKEKKKKKHKKRSRSKSRSPKPQKHQSTSKSKSKAHVKAKHSLPSAYRTVRQSRSRSRSPPKRHGHSPERRDRREDKERNVPSAYRNSNNPGISRKHSRSRSPQEKKKKKHSRAHESRTRSPMSYASPSRPSAYRNSAHSASISPVESRGSSQEHYRGVSQEKDGQISSAIVSSTQSKITQDLMAKVRAMIAASKKVQSSSSWHPTS